MTPENWERAIGVLLALGTMHYLVLCFKHYVSLMKG